LSIEGGIPGNQQRLVCPKCGKIFFAWRPDDLPGQKVKCYFCKHEFADEAALRPTPPTPIAVAPPPPVEPVAPAAEEPTPAESPTEPTAPANSVPEPTSEPA
jgi:hypothetical protein